MCRWQEASEYLPGNEVYPNGHYVKIKQWIELCDDDMYMIKLDKIITITETKDEKPPKKELGSVASKAPGSNILPSPSKPTGSDGGDCGVCRCANSATPSGTGVDSTDSGNLLLANNISAICP